MVYRIHGIIFISMGIKTLNLYLSTSSRMTLRATGLEGREEARPLPVACLSRDFSPYTVARPAPRSCYRAPVWLSFPHLGHRVFPSNPALPCSCSAVLSEGVLEPKCSELEVSAKIPEGRQIRAWLTGPRPQGGGCPPPPPNA